MANKTSLSAGYVVQKILSESSEVSGIVTKVFGVAVDKAVLPYVCHRLVEFEQIPTKSRQSHVDTVFVQVDCFDKTLEGSVELAEAVRSALDDSEYEDEEIAMRECLLTDASQEWEDDAYIVSLTFKIRI